MQTSTESLQAKSSSRLDAKLPAESLLPDEPTTGHKRPQFITFDEKQATVYVNTAHIVRLEYHPSGGRADLQLSDGHHYYLGGAAADRVLNQLEQCRSAD